MIEISSDIRQQLALALLTLFWILCPGKGVQAENLLQVYQQTLSASPVLAGAQADLAADRAARPIARAELMPKLGLAAGISRNRAEITGFAPLDSDQTYNGNYYSVSLTQPLFNGPAYVAQDLAEIGIKAGKANLRETRQQLILNVAEAYFTVLQARAEVEVARHKQQLLLQILDQAEAFREVGSGDIIAVHETRARADAAQAELVQAQNSLRLARQSLQRLTHQPSGRLDDLGPVEAQGPQPDRVESWVQAAFDQRPRLQQARQNMQAAQERIASARRARWPRMNLDARYSHVKGEILPQMERDELSAELNLLFPIYQGGAISAKARQAHALAQASRHSMENLQDQVQLETESAFFTLQNSVAALQAASQALLSARTSLRATREGYQVGVRSIIDLLTVTQDFSAIQRNYHVSRYHHVIARVRLKAAAGVLTVEDLEAINTLLSPADEASAQPERSR